MRIKISKIIPHAFSSCLRGEGIRGRGCIFSFLGRDMIFVALLFEVFKRNVLFKYVQSTLYGIFLSLECFCGVSSHLLEYFLYIPSLITLLFFVLYSSFVCYCPELCSVSKFACSSVFRVFKTFFSSFLTICPIIACSFSKICFSSINKRTGEKVDKPQAKICHGVLGMARKTQPKVITCGLILQ